MSIEFLEPVADYGGLAARLLIDDKTVTYPVSQECLEDIDPTHAQAFPLEQLEVNKACMLTIAENKINAGQVQNGVLRIYISDV